MLGSFPECTGEAELWEDVLFVFCPGDGRRSAAGGFSGKSGRSLRRFSGGPRWKVPRVTTRVFVGEFR